MVGALGQEEPPQQDEVLVLEAVVVRTPKGCLKLQIFLLLWQSLLVPGAQEAQHRRLMILEVTPELLVEIPHLVVI